MAKIQRQRQQSAIDTAAKFVGRTLGQAEGSIDALKARHPHPLTEAHEALTAGQETLTDIASRTATTTTAVVKRVKAAARSVKKAARRTRRRSTKMAAGAKRTTRKVVRRAKKAARRARTTVSRGTSRLRRLGKK